MKGLVVKKDGKILETDIQNTNMEHLAKVSGFTSKNQFKKHHTFHYGDYYYTIFGKTTGKAGSENKYELPPPIDNILFFNSIFILKSSKTTNTSYIHIKNVKDLLLKEWKNVYETLFGGFEDLGETDTSSEDELKHIDKKHLTKQGYLKDDFVVDDEDDDEEDQDDDDDDDEEDQDDEDDDEDEDEDDQNEDDISDIEYSEDNTQSDMKTSSKKGVDNKKNRFALKIDPNLVNVNLKNKSELKNTIVIDDIDELTEDSFV